MTNVSRNYVHVYDYYAAVAVPSPGGGLVPQTNFQAPPHLKYETL